MLNGKVLGKVAPKTMVGTIEGILKEEADCLESGGGLMNEKLIALREQELARQEQDRMPYLLLHKHSLPLVGVVRHAGSNGERGSSPAIQKR